MSKNGHFAKGTRPFIVREETFFWCGKFEIIVISRKVSRPFAVGYKTVPQACKCGKMVTSRTRTRPFLWWRGYVFQFGKNGHFANCKPAFSHEARIRSQATKVQKLSLRKWGRWNRLWGRTFFWFQTVEKIVISRTLDRPFRRRLEYVSSGSETYKNVHFANGNTAV